MGNVKFDYETVNSKTASIKKRAQDNLKTYAETAYGKIKDAMESSKGDYKTGVVAELAAEKTAVVAAADFIIKLQEMMKQTASAFQATDQSYSNGAAIIDKK